MLKLYYSKGACSLAPHIVLQALQLPHELKLIDPRKGDDQTPEFLAINPMGQVPVLITDDEEIITEVSAILQYLADLKPELKLAPQPGTRGRVRLQEWLNFIATELHKGWNPLFNLNEMVQNTEGKAELEKWARATLANRLDATESWLATQDTCLESGYSVADAYLFTVLAWAKYTKVDLGPWRRLSHYFETIRTRPEVQAAIRAEGIRSLAIPLAE